jgi:hypothetical protein
LSPHCHSWGLMSPQRRPSICWRSQLHRNSIRLALKPRSLRPARLRMAPRRPPASMQTHQRLLMKSLVFLPFRQVLSRYVVWWTSPALGWMKPTLCFSTRANGIWRASATAICWHRCFKEQCSCRRFISTSSVAEQRRGNVSHDLKSYKWPERSTTVAVPGATLSLVA